MQNSLFSCVYQKFVYFRIHIRIYTRTCIHIHTYTTTKAICLRSNAIKYKSNINHQHEEKTHLKRKLKKIQKKITKLLRISKTFIFYNNYTHTHKKNGAYSYELTPPQNNKKSLCDFFCAFFPCIGYAGNRNLQNVVYFHIATNDLILRQSCVCLTFYLSALRKLLDKFYLLVSC